MIHVEQGGEYDGETYIWCGVCSGGQRPIRQDEQGLFEGDSLLALLDFLKVHQHGD